MTSMKPDLSVNAFPPPPPVSASVAIFRASNDGGAFKNQRVILDAAPDKDLIDRVLQAVGELSEKAGLVEVPFVALLEEAGLTEPQWGRGVSLRSLTVPLGPRGAKDVQTLEMGVRLAHHGLIVGKTGSGKTNLMHVIITALALAYDPNDLELYLIDFKKGVGFKPYANHHLPHAYVIAIESEREFGLSVLRKLDTEMSERGKLFRDAGGPENLENYYEKTQKSLPRILLIADEFQEFFAQGDSLSQEAQLLLERLAKQGRQFGMHILLGTQTLASSNGLHRSTLEQMAIRIALQCSDADSRLILGDDNPAARYLSRPGEAIYNAENGQISANKLFQVARFDDKDKEEYLEKIHTHYSATGWTRKPIVFEGHAPALLHENDAITALFECDKPDLRKGVRAWLGEPIAIKDPTNALFRRQAGANLAIVTREEEQGLGVLSAALITLAMQHTEDDARFVIGDYTSGDADWSDLFETMSDLLPHETQLVRRRQMPDAIQQIKREVEARQAKGSAPAGNLFFLIAGVHRAREIRKEEDDYSSDAPSDSLLQILRDGPDVAVHTVLWSDTVAGLSRILGRKALAEFGLRAAAQMSTEESQALLDDGAAARIDRPHRMLLFDEQKPGVLEKFRPFALPNREWLERTLRRMQE